MADNSDSRSRRATALEEKKRRLEELKARRAAAATEDATTTSANFGATAPGKGGTGGGLDDYIDNLLSSSVPLHTSEESTSIADAKKDVEKELEPKKESPTEEITPAISSTVPPSAASPKKKHVETFEVGTQTEEGDFPPPLTASSDSEGEDETTANERALAKAASEEKKDSQDDDQNSKGTQVTEFHLLTEEEKDERMKDSSFGTFVVKASKRVEKLLEQQDTNSFLAAALWEEPYTLDEEKEEEDAEDSNWEDAAATKGLLQSGGHSRISLECSKWTHTRFVTDLDWSGVHNEVLVASYNQTGSATMHRSATYEDKESTATNTNLMASKGTPSSFISAQYSKEAANSDGLAMVWSLTMPHRPEFLFTSGASGPIGCIKFLPSLAGSGTTPDNQHLVVGGCDNGQLLLWDLRNGRLPVQKSNLSVAPLKGKNVNHAFRICALKVAEGGSGLVSASSDGRVNIWSLSNLRDPAESYMVEGNVSTLAVTPESHSIVCGDERGGLHSIVLPSSAQGGVSGSAPVGDNKRIVRSLKLSSSMDVAPSTSLVEGGSAPLLPGHFGMITSIATHSTSGTGAAPFVSTGRSLRRGFLRSVQGMFLTTGVDWTTKLWAPAFSDDAPLLNFTSSSYDYMADVTWCPTNPTVFATSSTTGTIDMWNLAYSVENPLSGSDGLHLNKIMRQSSSSGGVTPSLGPVNKMEWSNDGKRIAVAAGDQIHVIGVSETVHRAKGDEETRLMNHLTARGLVQRDD